MSRTQRGDLPPLLKSLLLRHPEGEAPLVVHAFHHLLPAVVRRLRNDQLISLWKRDNNKATRQVHVNDRKALQVHCGQQHDKPSTGSVDVKWVKPNLSSTSKH